MATASKSFFRSGTIGDEFTETAPARWAVMQAVVSPGPNPLPAEIRLKFDESENFYGVDQNLWMCDNTSMPTKVYRGRTHQMLLRKFIEEMVIITFSKLVWYAHEIPKVYMPGFEKPTQHMLKDIVGEVKNRLVWYNNEGDFLNAVMQIGYGTIAEMCIKLTNTVRAGKNSKYHATELGATVCNVAALISTLKAGDLPRDYHPQLSLRGVTLGGPGHASEHTIYVEYMTSQKEPKLFSSVPEVYLQHNIFHSKKHAEIVKRIFAETLPNCDYPTPRPVSAYSADFATTYLGTHILDGVSKLSGQDIGTYSALLVLHSLQQLTFRDEALALLTTSRTFTLYSSKLNQINGRVNTSYRKFPVYVLDHPTHMEQTDFAEWAQEPAGLDVISLAGTTNHVNVCPPNTFMATKWESIHDHARRFCITIFNVIDVLVERFDNIMLDEVEQQKATCFKRGLYEPNFWSPKESAAQTKRISDQSRFKYCSRTMDRE